MNDLVSIIVPCYNYGHLLAETLESLQKQTYRHWEALIIDDGSTDNTAEAVQQFAEKDDRLRYIYQKNQGLSAARNTGLREARGAYLQFLDADDLLSAEKLERQVTFMQSHPEEDITYTRCYYFKSGNPEELFLDYALQGNDWMPRTSGQGNTMVKALLKGNMMPVNSPLLKNSVLEKVNAFDPEMKSLEDWDFWIKCALSGLSFRFLDHPQAYALVRVHDASMSRDTFKMCLYELKVRKQAGRRLGARSVVEASEEQGFLQDRGSLRDRGSLQPVNHETLQRVNRQKEAERCKQLFRELPAGDIRRLRLLLNTLGWKKFLRHYISALNRKRKNVPL